MFEPINIIIYISIYIGLVTTTFFILSLTSQRKIQKPLLQDSELPQVSVIIPAYNEEKTIAQTIKSATESDYPKDKLEIIVIDDGSRDKTLEIAKKLESQSVKVLHKENRGKGSALNLGIKNSKAKIIFTMDADTTINPEAIKKMTKLFKDKQVMSVSPAMVTKKPKGILQKIQNIEYLWGLFLRKAFASINSIYITPGAFSGFRKEFFDKYGGYQENNLTEDLEISLRIQFNGFRIENCPEAVAYTTPPKKFRELLIQRRRWYFGTIKNLLNYKKIISPKYGDLGTFIIPIGIISTLCLIIVIIYSVIKIFLNLRDELIFLQSINFDFSNLFQLNLFIIERFVFMFISDPLTILMGVSLLVMVFCVIYGSKKINRTSSIAPDMFLFSLLFSLLYGFWWIVSIFYSLIKKEVNWRQEHKTKI